MNNRNTCFPLPIKLCIAICTVTLSACMFGNESNTAFLSGDNDEIRTGLLTAATSIESHLAELKAAQQQRKPALLNTAKLITPEGGLGGSADIDWTGPIAPLINSIAKRTDYRMKILGSEPAIPVIVSITQKNAILADILKNAGMQGANRASIVVYPETRIIELRYQSK